MTKLLRSLASWNAERRERYYAPAAKDVPNGIACPQCGGELVDSHPNVVLTSLPPKKDVHCPHCGHTDYRVA